MTKKEFVEAVKLTVGQSSVADIKSILKTPISSQSDEKSVELSNWYNKLSLTDKENLHQVVEKSIDMCLFGTFCVLDGVRVIENNSNKGELVLEYRKDGNSYRLNEEKGLYLHDIYNS